MKFLEYLFTASIINMVLYEYLNQKYKNRYQPIHTFIIFLFHTLIIAYINILEIPLLNLLGNVSTFMLVSFTNFNHEAFKDYYEDLIYLFILILLDSISFFLIGFLYGNNNNVYIFRNISSSLLVVFFNMTVKKYIKYVNIEDVPLKELILYFIITLFYIFLIYIISKDYDYLESSFSKSIIMSIVIGHVLIDLSIYYYLSYVGKTHQMEKKMIESSKQIEIKNSYYKNFKKNYEETQKIIHDFKNYIQVLENICENSSKKTHKKIAKQIMENLDNGNIKYDTSSEILDIILLDKEKICKDKQIEFKFKMEFVDLTFISELDIITIFGNLYDNAIEANETVKGEKFLNTVIYKINEMLIIRIENSCNNKLKYKNGCLKSTKINHSGIGTSNINSTLQKYNGIFDLKINNNTCVALITIPIK